MKKTCAFLTLALIFCLAAGPLLHAQEPYKLPQKDVIAIVDAPPTPRVSMSPARDIMALIDYEAMPTIAYISQPILRIAGIRITPFNNSRQVLSFSTGLSLKELKTGLVRKIALPDGAKFTGISWAPDGRTIAFHRYVENGIELWSIDVAAGTAKALTGPVVNAVTGGGGWMPDGKNLLVTLVPDGRGPAPEAPRVPKGPNVQETSGKSTKVATYQDLLKNAFDEALFDYYATAQLAIVDTATGAVRKIGRPGIFSDVSASPAMNYILVDRVKQPYSYSGPYSEFAHAYEIWDLDGRTVKLLADLPPAEDVPINGVPKGPRNADWMALKPATLLWTEAMDGGDPEKDVPYRDRMMTLPAPFGGEPVEALKLKERAQGLTPFGAPGLAFASEFSWKKRWRTTYLVDLDEARDLEAPAGEAILRVGLVRGVLGIRGAVARKHGRARGVGEFLGESVPRRQERLCPTRHRFARAEQAGEPWRRRKTVAAREERHGHDLEGADPEAAAVNRTPHDRPLLRGRARDTSPSPSSARCSRRP